MGPALPQTAANLAFCGGVGPGESGTGRDGADA